MLFVFLSLFLLFIISVYIYGSKQTSSSPKKKGHDSTEKNNERSNTANTINKENANNTDDDGKTQLHIAAEKNKNSLLPNPTSG